MDNNAKYHAHADGHTISCYYYHLLIISSWYSSKFSLQATYKRDTIQGTFCKRSIQAVYYDGDINEVVFYLMDIIEAVFCCMVIIEPVYYFMDIVKAVFDDTYIVEAIFYCMDIIKGAFYCVSIICMTSCQLYVIV